MHNKRDTGMIVLLPHWFDDVIRLGTGKLDTKPYEWPEPAVLAGGGKPSGKLDKEKQQLLASATSETVPKSRAGDVWAGKKLHLSEDLELGERREVRELGFSIFSYSWSFNIVRQSSVRSSVQADKSWTNGQTQMPTSADIAAARPSFRCVRTPLPYRAASHALCRAYAFVDTLLELHHELPLHRC